MKQIIYFLSEKSDSSSQRSKSEHRGSVVRQSSAPNPSSRRIARAKDLIIPAFTSAGRRIRRPSVDQGPIQIKLGRSNSTKSIEATGSFPKVYCSYNHTENKLIWNGFTIKNIEISLVIVLTCRNTYFTPSKYSFDIS